MIPDYTTPGAIVRLRDGGKARIYATDGAGGYPIHGAAWIGTRWVLREWTREGFTLPDAPHCPSSIVGPWIDEPDASKLWPQLPPWIEWLAKDRAGTWYGYECKPLLGGEGSPYFHSPIGTNLVVPSRYAPTFTGDWSLSLCRRPKA